MTLTVQPIRFTDNIDAMSDLLVALGLSVSISSDKGGWVVLSGRTGTVALHSASRSATDAMPGQTSLSFEATGLDELARTLTASGFGSGAHPDESMVYDEAYGRAITIQLGGERLTINAAPDDLYGYASTGVRSGIGDLRVMPVRFVADPTADRRLLEDLGFSMMGAPEPHFTQLTLPGTGGAVGLHPIPDGEVPVIPGPFAVQLHFDTTTPLAEIMQRAESTGARAELRESEFGDHVTITDPDGQQLQVHPASE